MSAWIQEPGSNVWINFGHIASVLAALDESEDRFYVRLECPNGDVLQWGEAYYETLDEAQDAVDFLVSEVS